jgi:hypothetical protein
VLIFKIIWNSKNKIIYYQSLRVNRIDRIILSISHERGLGREKGRNEEVKCAEGGAVLG